VSAPAFLAVLLAAVLAGCGTSKYHYVTSKAPKLSYKIPVGTRQLRRQVVAADTYFKVPRAWAVYSTEQMLAAMPGIESLSPGTLIELSEREHVTGFDASSDPSPANLYAVTTAPSGREIVHVLDDDERDSVSLSDLRNFPYPVDGQDAEADSSEVEVLYRDDEVVRPGGFHGTQVLFNVKTDKGLTYTLNQTTLTDSASRLLYTFLIGCEALCYGSNVDTINEVVASWTIKERK
jgi:hypothetical protein